MLFAVACSSAATTFDPTPQATHTGPTLTDEHAISLVLSYMGKEENLNLQECAEDDQWAADYKQQVW